MFADRLTAVVDACALAGALKRNLLLTLAEAEFFRLRWSARILDETQAAIAKMLGEKGVADAFERAARARVMMEAAFEEATVSGFEAFLPSCCGLPDPDDAHVLAAALRCDAAVIVTDNLRHFPASVLGPLGLDALSTDAFLADMVSLDEERAVDAIKRMRLRLKRPEKTAKLLLDDMKATELVATATVLKAFEPML